MSGILVIDDIEIRGDGITVSLNEINHFFNGTVEFLIMGRGGLPEIVHDDRISQLIVGKKLAVPIINISSC